jgi:hypothetical protein
VNGVPRDAVRMWAAASRPSGQDVARVRLGGSGYPLGMTHEQQPSPGRPGADELHAAEDTLHLTPGVAGPSGTGKATDRVRDDDAGGVSEGADGGDS